MDGDDAYELVVAGFVLVVGVWLIWTVAHLLPW